MVDEWRETTIGEFAPFAYGKALPEHQRDSSGDVPVFGSNGVVGFHREALTSGPTVIVGRKGTVGAVHYSPNPCWPIDTTFYVVDLDPDALRFKYYLLKSLDMEHMNADSAVPGLNRDAAHALKISVPPLRDRRAIAHILGTLDDKIELNRRMSETLEAMAQTLFKAWFVDFEPVRAKMEGRWRRGQSLPGIPAHLYDLFPDRLVESELGEIPEGWEVRKLGDLMELAYGKALKAEDRRDGEVPVYGSNGQVGWHNEWLARGPGIVVGRKGNPGIVTWAPTDFFVIDTAFYVVPKNTCHSIRFLFHALRTHDLASLGADSAVPGLNRNLIYMSPQLLPPSMLLQKFDEIVRSLDERVHKCSHESRTLATLRDTLLPKLIRGEMRVKDAERFLKERGL